MEVFMRNVPADLTVENLKTQLDKYTKALAIPFWECEKPRKKPFGTITFLNKPDGERFLRIHGKKKDATLRFVSSHVPLVIFGVEVSCLESTRALDKYRLKHLAKMEAEAQQEQQRQKKAPADEPQPHPPEGKVVFSTSGLSCGFYDYNDNKELVYCPELSWQIKGGTTKFAKWAIIISLDGISGKRRIEIPYRTIEALVISVQSRTFTLTLWETPRFFETLGPTLVEAMAALSVQRPSPTALRSRLVDIPGGTYHHREISGQSLVYQISVSPVEFHDRLEKLYRKEVLTIYRYQLPTPPVMGRKHLRKGLKDFARLIQDCTQTVPFSILYQMEALVKNGFLLPWVVGDLLRKVAKLSQGSQFSSANSTRSGDPFPISAGAIKKLFPQIPFAGPETEPWNFSPDELWKCIEDNEREIRTGLTKDFISERGRQNLTLVHKVNITPTGMTLHGPEPEAKNRILRRFSDNVDFFVRVQFCDEDGSDLQFNARVSNETIYERFKSVFKNGIPIGGRLFGFLGFSHSSLRSHAAWFMAPFVHGGELQTYFSVISRLGTFDGIQSPARCAARIGQAFSETPLAISLSQNGIQHYEIPDVKSPDGSRVFSDGVGTISRKVMEAIHATLPSQKQAPTCFQIRWGGAKGMLALDPHLDGMVMRVRPSMIKFPSEDIVNLEICDMGSKPIPMVLNRQMIKILEDMGVSDEWFLKQQSRAVETLQYMTAHIANTVAFLKRQKVADNIGFPQFLRQLDTLNIDYRRDRFLRSVVEATILRELRLLKHKAKIPIDEGVTLFGIMDETGYLEEGEVYISFDKTDHVRRKATELHGRRMIITRSPGLHPGDIQLATNIIPPQFHYLRSLRNCIVFSQKGQRDLPSCLSGGDLDGDIFGVIWDHDAVAQCTSVEDPADYPRVEPLSVGRTVEREDMTDFFIKFMATDQLGIIANKHMILADQRDQGTVDPGCKMLAEMHSTGVDYSKTGVPVNMSKLREIKMNKYRPDFLSPAPPTNIKDRLDIDFDEKPLPSGVAEEDEDDVVGPNYQYYYSEKINGKLYRSIDERKIWYDHIRAPIDKLITYPSGNIWDELAKHINIQCHQLGGIKWHNQKKEALEIRRAYEDMVWNATLDYSDHATIAITELEVFTGSLFNKTGAQTRRQRDKSLKLKDEYDRMAKWAVAMIRKRDLRILRNEDEEDIEPQKDGSDESLSLSIACLNVGLETELAQSYRAGRYRDAFESFKVVAACCALKELNAALKRREHALWEQTDSWTPANVLFGAGGKDSGYYNFGRKV
ncbi:RNA-dependent RNA polymerase [Amniculicola lignicola CBS 123094]|uniref:RNA-dependent RNA polymerase n=1 Tax=Amniculicola lignicola CBS 123094 TaxID=1392246 RepID=A0A6A5WS32_9PLEO|nr:RNA-dependent RNA polymerase [Amniculicola lignicola CBS 123094]